jgi:putative DNA primase/helicase
MNWIDDNDPEAKPRKNITARADGRDSRAGNAAGHEIPPQTGEDFLMQPVEWHWKGWLAYGKFHVLAGSKAAGKSTLGFDLMARTSSVGEWPDGTAAPIGDVIVWSGEDNIEDTILPRFAAAGGDLKRIYPIKHVPLPNGQSRPFDPSTDIPLLAEMVDKLPEPKMLMIDPVVLALAAQIDSHKNSETRRGLQPLVELAERRNIVLLGITHFTKGTADRDPVDRVTGSLAFGAIPRIVLGASADEDGRQRRLVRISSNIGPSGGGFEYTMFQSPLPGYNFFAQRISWGVQLRGAAKDLLNAARQSAQAKAAAFLAELLESGPQPSREVKAAAEANGHSWATVRLAQKHLGVKAKKDGKQWLFVAPAPVGTFPPERARD